MNKQVNPKWLKSLAVHVVALMVAAFIGLLATVNNETPEMVFHSLWVSLISPLIYPLLGPYMVAFLLATHKDCNRDCGWCMAGDVAMTDTKYPVR